MNEAYAGNAEIASEDRLRAHQYRLLARLLAAPPDEAVLQLAAGFEADDTPLGRGLGALARVAAKCSVQAAADEYFELFIGIGRGELVPYASYYRTGFLHDRPLAALRADMFRLGIARAEGVREPEDHIAALSEMMAGLIEGDFGAPLDLPAQRAFFDAHLAPWAGRFFGDLEAARGAVLYAPVGAIGRVFMDIEETAFGLGGCEGGGRDGPAAGTGRCDGHDQGEGDPMRKDQQEQAKPRPGRRDFLRLAGLGGVAAGAAALAGGATKAAGAATAPQDGGTGYRETEHVRRYYELARF